MTQASTVARRTTSSAPAKIAVALNINGQQRNSKSRLGRHCLTRFGTTSTSPAPKRVVTMANVAHVRCLWMVGGSIPVLRSR